MNDKRVVVVTGAAVGIGLRIAKRFDEEGHPTAMLDVQEEQLEMEAESLRRGGTKILALAVNGPASRQATCRNGLQPDSHAYVRSRPSRFDNLV